MSQAGAVSPGGTIGPTVVETLTGNTGGAVGPTGNNINVVGDGTTIAVAGDPGTSTLTISAIGEANPNALFMTTLTSNIDFTATGTTLVYTTNTGAPNFWISPGALLYIYWTTVTDFSVNARISLGTNSPDYNNIISNGILYSGAVVGTVSAYGNFANGTQALYVTTLVIPGNTAIYLNINTGATATALMAKVAIVGNYQ